MDYLRTDEEQGEAVKRWLRTNGVGLGLALVVGVGLVLGYQNWQDQKTQQQAAAAALYHELIELANIDYGNDKTDEEFNRLLSIASLLRQNHEQSNYAALGAGIVAAQAVERLDFDLAVGQLTYALSTVTAPELKALISLRLARLELELKDFDAAFARVQGIVQPEFEASKLELEGDILVSRDAHDRARVKYLKAQKILTSKALNTALIDLKLSALPEIDE